MRLYKTRLFELHTVLGLVIIPRVEEIIGIGALRNGACTLAKLDLVKADQAALAKVL
jgi:hypothetical protein